MDYVGCTGSESQLSSCPFSGRHGSKSRLPGRAARNQLSRCAGWGVHGCFDDHSEDVGVTCSWQARAEGGRRSRAPGPRKVYHWLPKPSILEVLLVKPYIDMTVNHHKRGFW